jgi:hypothetical protein
VPDDAFTAGSGIQTSPQVELRSRLVEPFPTPHLVVTSALEQLELVDQAPPETECALPRAEELPRPWDPATCNAFLRSEIWMWLEDVARWINEQQLWNLASPGIPGCWPAHPHLVHDLATVACARYAASRTSTPRALGDWHHHTLPGFLDRIDERLGDACASGNHQPAPRGSRNRGYRTAHNHDRRRAMMYADFD